MEDPGLNMMRMKYTCTYLPNKVGSCPKKTFLKSNVSGTVNKLGGFGTNFGEDWGSHELANMASRHQCVMFTKQ